MSDPIHCEGCGLKLIRVFSCYGVDKDYDITTGKLLPFLLCPVLYRLTKSFWGRMKLHWTLIEYDHDVYNTRGQFVFYKLGLYGFGE